MFSWIKNLLCGHHKLSEDDFKENIYSNINNFFVNREDAIGICRKLVSRRLNQSHILSLFGESGSGKTWLIHYIKKLFLLDGMIVSLVSGSEIKSQLDILNIINSDLILLGYKLNKFTRMYNRYKEISIVLSETGHHYDEKPIGNINIIPDEFLNIIRNKLKKEDIYFYFNALPKLTETFVSEIMKIACVSNKIIFIDSYEKISHYENWLLGVLSKLTKGYLFVFTSQSPVNHVFAELGFPFSFHEILRFNDNVSLRCIENYANKMGIGDAISSSVKNNIMNFSLGLPIALATSIKWMSQYNVDIFADHKKELIDNLLNLLATVPPNEAEKAFKIKNGIDILSIPRLLDMELINYLFGKYNLLSIVSEIIYLPFINSKSTNNFELHDIVRSFIYDKLRKQELQKFIEINENCLEYYNALYNKLDPIDNQMILLEILYHSYFIDNNKGFDKISEYINDTFMKSNLSLCSLIIDDFQKYFLLDDHNFWVQYWKGELAYRRGDWDNALMIIRPLISRVENNHLINIQACTTLGRINYQQGDLSNSEKMFQKSFKTMEATGNQQMKGYVLEQLSKVYRMKGDLRTAIRFHRDAIKNCLDIQDYYGICSALGSYGTTLIMVGRFVKGATYLGRSIAYARRFGFRQFLVTGLRSRAIGFLYLGKYRDAEIQCNESLEIAKDLEDGFNLGLAKLRLSQVKIARGDSSKLAEKLLFEAIKHFEQSNAKYDMVNATMELGLYFKKQNKIKKALFYYNKAVSSIGNLKFEYGIGWLYYYLGDAYLQNNDINKSHEYLNRAFEFAELVGSQYLIALILLIKIELNFKSNTNYEENKKLIEKCLLLAKKMRYYDIISKLYIVKIKYKLLLKNYSHELEELIFLCLKYSIRFNCFIFDNNYDILIKEFSEQIGNNDILKNVILKSNQPIYFGVSLSDLEENNRYYETGQSYSRLRGGYELEFNNAWRSMFYRGKL